MKIAGMDEAAAGILEMLQPIDPRMLRSPVSEFAAQPPVKVTDAERRDVVTLLGPVPVAIDELIRQSGFSSAIVQVVLLEPELAGKLERHAGGRASLAE